MSKLVALAFITAASAFSVRSTGRARVHRAPRAAPDADAAPLAPLRALVIGGSGRVGGSTARWLLRLGDDARYAALCGGRRVDVAIGGRSRDNFEAFRRRLLARHGDVARALAAAPARLAFVRVDLADDASLDAALADGGGFDLVVHTAGPFQVGRRAPSLSLRPALENVRACPL